MTYRVLLAAGAAAKFHDLPEHARDALVGRAADLIERPWDDTRVLRPGDDPTYRIRNVGTCMSSANAMRW